MMRERRELPRSSRRIVECGENRSIRRQKANGAAGLIGEEKAWATTGPGRQNRQQKGFARPPQGSAPRAPGRQSARRRGGGAAKVQAAEVAGLCGFGLESVGGPHQNGGPTQSRCAALERDHAHPLRLTQPFGRGPVVRATPTPLGEPRPLHRHRPTGRGEPASAPTTTV